jgi:hypothetical protein
MISLDFFSDMDISDGAVLQYSIDGGNNWRIVGHEGSTSRDGINWFNGSSISSNPGSQLIGQYGWTGTATLSPVENQGEWKNGRFNLDMVPVANRNQVRLRIAFASNDGNPSAGPYDGFAFDNVFVGDKKRTVVVEHFTNAASLSADAANTYLDALYNNQTSLHALPDFFNIQYHINVPGTDKLNGDNPIDPGARAFFYDITQAPYTIMDGIIGNYFNKNFKGGYGSINDIEVDRRALEDPAFVVDTIIIDQTTASNLLKARVSIVYVDSVRSLNDPVIFQAALLETDIGGNKYNNVLRKLLLQTEGFTVNRAWKYKDVQTLDIDYTLDVPVADPTKLYLAVFVQDKTTKRMHQAAIVKAPAKVGKVPVGIIDDPATAEIRDINVYPNPASKNINFYLENVLSGNYSWEIVDQRGVTVLTGDLNHDLSSPQQVEIKDLANGIYFVRFANANKALVYRKIAVMNNH